MKKQLVFGILRHVLGAAGAYVVARGLATEGMVQEAAGAVLTLVAVAWSMIDKVPPVLPQDETPED
jgi:hypothetical protein